MNSTLANSTNYFTNEWNFSILLILSISFYVFSFVFILPLNIYIISLLFPTRGLMDACDVFTLNQAIAEIFFVLLGPFHCLCGINMCIIEATGFFLGIAMSSRCLFQCCVCFERYLAVVLPMTFVRFKPLRYRVMCSITVWMESLAVAIAFACQYPSLPYNVISALYVFILIVDIYCALSILNRLKHPGPRDVETNSAEMNAGKKKAFRIVSINLLMFLIQNIPVCIAFASENSVPKYNYYVAVVTAVGINSVTGIVHPLSVLRRAGKLPFM